MSEETNYDFRWKELIEDLFEDFLSFFLPDLYPRVDISKGVEFLDKELDKLIGSYKKKGYVVADKLVKVWLKNGSVQWIVIHIEVQSSDDKGFSERMFVYFIRLYEKYGKKIMALAIYTGHRVPKHYKEFVYKMGGTQLRYEFDVYLAREKSESELLKSENPFALAVLAGKYISQSNGKELSLYRAKLKLIRLAFNKGYSQERIRSLLRFVMYLIKLPKLEPKFSEKFIEIIKSKEMEITPMQKREAKRVLNALYEAHYGKTLDEIMAEKLAKHKEQVAEQKQQMAEQKEQMVEKEKKLENSIKLLLRLDVMSVKKIAEEIGVSEYKVRKIKKELKNTEVK